MTHKLCILIACALLINIAVSQTTYNLNFSQSAPEASLFFANPSYISPALAYGTYGMFANPAALGYTSDYGLNFVFGVPSKPKLNLTVQAIEATNEHGAIDIPVELTLRDVGGVNFIGFSKKIGPVGLGIGYMQKSSVGIGLDVNGSETFNVNYQITQPITATISPGYDTTIPLTWNISAPINLSVNGGGAINMGKAPLFLGGGYNFGFGSVGLGFKLLKYTGELGTNLNFTGSSNIQVTGTPASPFKGSITGNAFLTDTIISVNGNGEFSANRLSIVLGTLLQAGFFKMGLSVEQGFKTTLSGNYNLTTLSISGAPDSVRIDSNFVHFVLPDSIYGRAVLSVNKSPKSSDTLSSQQNVSLAGYTELNLGISLSVFDLYLGGTLPKKREVNNAKLGVLFSAPLSTVTIRTGLLASFDYLYFTDNQGKDMILPVRAPIYFGLGGSYRTPLNFIPYAPNAQIDFGIKSNVFSLVTKFLPEDLEVIRDVTSPSFFSSLSFNLGIGLSL
ncbi:MAG: hypothetical protein ABIK33_00330 [candidate division WOR-3 bacterium]